MLAARCLALLLMFAALVVRAEEPFSFANTPGHLPKSIVPQHYAIEIGPSIDAASLEGRETIDLEVREPVKQIILNSLGLEISEARLFSAADREGTALTPVGDEKNQTVTFALAEKLPAGAYKLFLAFRGKLNEQPQGLFLARYDGPGGAKRHALATQMEATDARRMFPCWDEPVFRATFQLTAIVPEKQVAVSNMPVEREAPLDGGRKQLTFAKTPSMPTYLVAFFAGDFEELSDEIDGVQLRIFTTPGKRAQARYAMESTKQVLPFFNEYFGTKYPLPKLDQVAVPSTGAAGMENWGAILYNDNALLFDPAASSQETRERVFEVIAHELAHQWFGNLVTMAWWDNLWLNEGFASWMGTKAADHFNPGWKVWLRAAGAKEWAMNLDARATTHPIQQPVPHESQATDAFDQITYSKGQAFLRMLESWLGEEPFREGIRKYMQRHAYSNTTTADLWTALGEASGKNVRKMAAGWTEQPGFPVINVVDVTGNDRPHIRLRQERFTIHQRDPKPLTWMIPVVIADRPGHKPRWRIELDEHVTFSALERDAVFSKVNAGDVGYYRVQYSDPLFAQLRQHLAGLADSDRLNLLNDTWALVQANRADVSRYLDLAATLATDEAYPIVAQIIDAMWFIDHLQRGQPGRDAFRAQVCALLARQFERVGWEPAPNEPPLTALLRSGLVRTLGGFGREPVVRAARERFAAFCRDPALLAGNLREAVFFVVGRNAAEGTWATLHDLAKRETSTEQRRNLHRAMASSPRAEDAARTLALSLSKDLLPREAARLVQRVAEEGEQPALALSFAREHLDELLAKLATFSANDYIPDIFRGFTDAARADELETFARERLPATASYAVAKAADDIRFKSELKQRLLPAVDAWCRQHAKE